jgi:ribosomal protein S18 acetylase RimI-like enzyme
VLRLEPMDDAAFEAFLRRAVPRRAERWVARGIWTPDRALEASRQAYAEQFPQGRKTPGNCLYDVVDTPSGSVVGEAWYTAREGGGKITFWIEWIAIWPEYRRRGFGSELLGLLEQEALRLGADRTGLTVWTDNPRALALYTKLGYTAANVNMVKPAGGTRPPEAEVNARPDRVTPTRTAPDPI